MSTPLETLNAAIQAFASHLAAEMGDEEPVLVNIAVVLWEQVNYDQADVQRQVMYTVPTDDFSIAGAIGLCEAGRILIRRDTLKP